MWKKNLVDAISTNDCLRLNKHIFIFEYIEQEHNRKICLIAEEIVCLIKNNN